MSYNFHLVFEKGDKFFIGYCPEVPGANGQGETQDACRENLLQAIDLMLLDRYEDGIRGVPAEALVEILSLN